MVHNLVFVFVIDKLHKNCGPVVNIVMSLSMKIRERGHKVYAIVRGSLLNEIYENYIDAFDEVNIINDEYVDKLERFKVSNKWDHLGFGKKFFAYIRNPEIIPAWLDWKLYQGVGKTKKLYKSMIEKMDETINPDVIISFMMPHWTEECISEADIKSQKGIFQMDPYVHFVLYDKSKCKERIRKEQKILSKVDKVFVTSCVYREMIDDSFEIDYNKVIIYDFPGIHKDNHFSELEKKISDVDTIHFYFVGNLIENIRNPEFVLKLFLSLPSNYVLHFVGSGLENILTHYKTKFGERLILHGSVPVEEAYGLMRNADILLNIGNSVDNMIPSKLFDYFNTGLPIINVYSVKECPSLSYMDKYPLGVSVYEADGKLELARSKVIEFVENNCGKVVQHDEVLRLFYNCTDEFVAGQIIDAFQT